jgi:hypothetical protein
MTMPSDNEVSELLHAWSSGDEAALEQLTPIVSAELHRVAWQLEQTPRALHLNAGKCSIVQTTSPAP